MVHDENLLSPGSKLAHSGPEQLRLCLVAVPGGPCCCILRAIHSKGAPIIMAQYVTNRSPTTPRFSTEWFALESLSLMKSSAACQNDRGRLHHRLAFSRRSCEQTGAASVSS